MNLLSKDILREISQHIYDSDILINLSSFEFIEDFEKFLLKEFESFKFIFDKLDLPDKNDVIKFWTSNRGNEFDRYLEYSPDNFKNFDVLDFHNISSEDTIATDSLLSSSPLKIFYPEHYKSKFINLIIYFLLFEEEYIKEVLINPAAKKGKYNPFEWLDLKGKIENNEDKDAITKKLRWTHNTTVCFFHLLRDSGIYPKRSYQNREYCIMLCEVFNIPFKEKIAKIFVNYQLLELYKVQKLILPKLEEQLRIKLEEYILKMKY